MKINWTPRLKSKKFWVTMIPLVLLLAQQIAGVFGVKLDIAGLSNQLLYIIGTVFSILAGIGIVTDPTTPGLSDSRQAQSYGPLVTSKATQAIQARDAAIQQLTELQKQVEADQIGTFSDKADTTEAGDDDGLHSA